ncbi:MAG: hypothetical protein FWD61_07855 [Phycisphaerales bacterium]|nr:hypothetical protein [Phycisphaerales bacterium]
MKFVKANLDLLIAGLLVILAIGAYFWPLSPYKEELRDKAKERLAKENSVRAFIFNKQHPIVIPGIGPIPGANDPGNATATYTQNLTDAKGEAQKQMKDKADEIIRQASADNHRKRVKVVTSRDRQGKTSERFIPLLPASGEMVKGNLQAAEQDHLLPVAQKESWGFRDDYLKQFANWNAKLGFAPLPVGGKGLQDDIDKRVKEETETMLRNAIVGVGGGGGTSALLPAEKVSDIKKSVISKRAASIRMYIDDNAFPMPEWAKGAVRVQPSEMQMFDALGSSWLINDVVNAIAEVNKGSANVGASPIKRLEAITVGVSGVGSGAAVTGGAPQGNFFLTAPTTSTSVSGVSAAYNSQASSAGQDNRSMTGHVSDPNYGVTLMNVRILIEPGYVNSFINALYQQNNGYTVLSIKTTPVDPFDAAGNGYLYGKAEVEDKAGKAKIEEKTQVVRVEIHVENLLFRTWLDQIMPNAYRSLLPPPNVSK